MNIELGHKYKLSDEAMMANSLVRSDYIRQMVLLSASSRLCVVKVVLFAISLDKK